MATALLQMLTFPKVVEGLVVSVIKAEKYKVFSIYMNFTKIMNRELVQSPLAHFLRLLQP